MKTAISLPDDTFQGVERESTRLGINRSEFYTKTALRYLDELDVKSLTRLIDQVIDTQGQSDDSAINAITIGHRLLLGQMRIDDR